VGLGGAAAVAIRCLECRPDFLLCVNCFAVGAEVREGEWARARGVVGLWHETG